MRKPPCGDMFNAAQLSFEVAYARAADHPIMRWPGRSGM